uniref:Claspin n=1 Tax=Glossina brevipalpis TaxID=37001 RepID=A0A1A9W7N3_9MUSC
MDELANDAQHQLSVVVGNASMGELKMEDHAKEKSLEEDILGSENLRMSDSEEEFDKSGSCNESSLSSAVSHAATSIMDRGNENHEAMSKSTIKEEKDNMIVTDSPLNKKAKCLIDSDTEDEQNEMQYELKNNKSIVHKNSSRKVFSIVDTESEEESNETTNQSGISTLNGDYLETVKSKQKNTEKSDGVKQKYSTLIDSDSDSESQTVKLDKNDLEIEELIQNNAELQNKESPKNTITTKREKVMRASAKKALDEMHIIQSEQQRLHRETHVSIRYHKPKKRTLEEFLKRRTIIKPQLDKEEDSPLAAVMQAKNLKMTTEELQEYAKLMEERAKEACEFFKSESEDERDFVNNNGILDKLSVMEKEFCKDDEKKVSTNAMLHESVHEEQEILDKMENLDFQKVHLKVVQQSEEKSSEIFDEELSKKSPAKVIITEVIELPKLDMNSINISPVKPEPVVKPTTFPNVKQLLDKKHLPIKPSLSGDPSKLINLETGDLIEKKPNGMESLMQRLMSTVKVQKPKALERCNILTLENGNLEVTSVNVNIKGDENSVKKEPRPGAAYFKLKKNLKQIIRKKRLEELHKKQEEEKMECGRCSTDNEEDYDDFEEEDESNELSNNETKGNKEFLVDIHGDEQLEVEDHDQGDEFEAKEINEIQEEETSIVDKLKDNNHVTKSFPDTNENCYDLEMNRDDIDFLKTQPLSRKSLLLATQADHDLKRNEGNEYSESFYSTQQPTTALISQIPLVENNIGYVNYDELMHLCSGSFDQGFETQKQQNEDNNIQLSHKDECKNILAILSSDEDNDDEEEEPLKHLTKKPRKKKLTKRINKKKAKLGFSDDEQEEEIAENQGNDLEENVDTIEPEPETFVDYDSEENEILVHLTKDERVQEAGKFFEKEAELSESEWGSGDEDEGNDMDKYDSELGDEDEFDKEKLRSELGKIHARKMLDEDIKDVRKFQEMFLEDEENDGIGRQRQFKWQNRENGFSLEDMQRAEISLDDIEGNCDDQNEHEWRKIRYEREQFLKEKGIKLSSQDNNTAFTKANLSTIPTASFNCKKLQIVNTKKGAGVAETITKSSSPFLISKDANLITMNRKKARGSFLVRDRETLNKLANLTKGKFAAANLGGVDDTSETILVKTAKAKNFVFATLTEEEHETLKRKADNLLNTSDENGVNYMKKPKFEPRRDKCFIDQLL